MIRFLVACLVFPTLLTGQRLDTARSRVTFTIRNLGLAVEGRFAAPRGTAVFDPANASSSRLNIRVPSATIETGLGMRDRHLRDKDYFDATHHPELRFVSSRITCTGTQCVAEGKLTLKATTKPVRIPFTATRTGAGWRLTGSFSVNRRDYGIGGWSPTLSDEATVTVVLGVQE